MTVQPMIHGPFLVFLGITKLVAIESLDTFGCAPLVWHSPGYSLPVASAQARLRRCNKDGFGLGEMATPESDFLWDVATGSEGKVLCLPLPLRLAGSDCESSSSSSSMRSKCGALRAETIGFALGK